MARKYPVSVYVSCHDGDAARELVSAVRSAGHLVVSTWHDEPPVENWSQSGALGDDKKQGANVNLRLVANRAQVLVLIAGPEKYPGGKFVEAGVALGNDVPVVCYGRRENGMLHADGVWAVDGFSELLAFLDNFEAESDN